MKVLRVSIDAGHEMCSYNSFSVVQKVVQKLIEIACTSFKRGIYLDFGSEG